MKPHQLCCQRCQMGWRFAKGLALFFVLLFGLIVAATVRADEAPQVDRPGSLYYLTDTPTREQWSVLMREGDPPFTVCLSAARRDWELAENERKDRIIAAAHEHIASLEFENELLKRQLTEAEGERDAAVDAQRTAEKDALVSDIKRASSHHRILVGTLAFFGGAVTGASVGR